MKYVALFLLLSCTTTRPKTAGRQVEDWNTIRLTAAVIQLQKDNAALMAMAKPVDTTQWMLKDGVLVMRPVQMFETLYADTVRVGRGLRPVDSTKGPTGPIIDSMNLPKNIQTSFRTLGYPMPWLKLN